VVASTGDHYIQVVAKAGLTVYDVDYNHAFHRNNDVGKQNTHEIRLYETPTVTS
jgi:hypothetical protein